MAFMFDLKPSDIKRNNQITPLYDSLNQVIFGGLTLAVKSIKPRQPKFEIRQKSWVTKTDLGIAPTTKVTFKTNPDGTQVRIAETVQTMRDGTVIKTTTEHSFASADVLNSTTYTESIPFALDGSNELDLDKAKRKKTQTIVTPQSSSVAYITEVVETKNDDGSKSTYEKTLTEQQMPVEQADPIKIKTVNGTIIWQNMLPPPPQGINTHPWNDNMTTNNAFTGTASPSVATAGPVPSSALGPGIEKNTIENVVDNNDGTETITKQEQSRNYRGELTTIDTTIIKTKELNDNHTSVTMTETKPRSEKKVIKDYDINGVLKSTRTIETSQFDDFTGNASSILEKSTDITTNELGKITRKETSKETNPQTGQELSFEEEVIEDPGQPLIKFSRSITTDLTTGVSEVKETKTVTDGYGVEKTYENSYKRMVDTFRTTVERTSPDDLEDSLLDDLINGFLITEYEISGQLISADQAFMIMNKCHDHQSAWCMLQVLEEQLSKGDKISPKKRSELYHQWQAIFLGDVVSNVRGGPVLDRIHLNAFGETDLEVVFASGQNSFSIDWIDGAKGLYSWSMVVQTFSSLIREKTTSALGKPRFGGRYGRLDGKHWRGNSAIPELLDSTEYANNLKKFVGPEDGGTWQYD